MLPKQLVTLYLTQRYVSKPFLSVGDSRQNRVRHFMRSSLLFSEESGLNAPITEEATKKFLLPSVQKLLKTLTGMEMDKVFRSKALGEAIPPPQYKFMTTEQIKEEEKKAFRRAKTKLQMPPVVPVKEDKLEIIAESPEIIGYDNAKFVFIDISFGVSDAKRLIVVREPSGVLRKAFKNERHRMNSIYSPRPGRMLRCPRMFQKENLERLWEEGQYEFILDRACCQFEPDDEEYHNVVLETYRRVNEQKAFNKLRSTRHYGPLVFCLALNRNIDNLLLENLDVDRIDDALNAVFLYNTLNPDAKSASLKCDFNKKIEFLKAFCETESKNPGKMILALNSYVDVTKERKKECTATG